MYKRQGIDTAAFGGRIILDDDGDTYIEAPTDDTIDIYVAGAKDFTFTANTFTAHSGSNVDLDGDLDVAGTTNLDVVDIDGAVDMASTLQVDGSITSSDGMTITTADNTDTLTLTSTDADGDFGPNLRFYRNSSTPADADNLALLDFEGRNDNSQDVVYGQIMATTEDVSDGTEDGAMNFRVMKDGTSREHIRMSGASGVIINEASLDIDFRVESNGNTHMLFVDGGNNRAGFVTTPDLGHVHIRVGDSGGSVSQYDALVIEEDDNCGITLLSGNTGAGRIVFGDSGDNDIGAIGYEHGADDMIFVVAATEMLRIDSDNNNLATGGETAGDVGAFGLCLNQGTADGNILTFKSSDISHGFTGQFDADTYGVFKKNSTTAGGLQILGIAEDDPGINIFGVADTTSGTVASNTNAVIHLDARKTSSGSVGTIGTDMMCLFSNDGVAKVIFTGAGNIHSDSSATVGTYDAYEDAHLVRAYDLSHGKGVIDSKFDKFVSYNAEKLADLELIGRDDDGTPNSFVNVTGFQRLHNGAIWQQYEKTERLANAMYELAKAAVGEEKANEILEQNEIKLLN